MSHDLTLLIKRKPLSNTEKGLQLIGNFKNHSNQKVMGMSYLRENKFKLVGFKFITVFEITI